MRIVSLLSSATEIVYLLGLQDQLVGISHECDYPADALSRPRVSRPRFDPSELESGEIDAAVRDAMATHGSVYEVDLDLLRELRPDLILTQAVCEVCAVPTGSVTAAVASLPGSPRVLSLDAHTLEGIVETVRQVGDAAGESARGREAASSLGARLDRVAEGVAGRPRPRVLALEWLDPPFAPGHWVPEMVETAGGENLAGTAGARSEQVGWEDLEGLSPDLLLIAQCGYDLAQARRDADAHRQRLRELGGDRISDGSAWLLHSAYFSRSGPRVVDGVEVLARLFHPQHFPNEPLGGRAELWS